MVCFHMVTDCDCNEAHQILEDTSTSIRRMWGYTHLRSDMDGGHKMFANNIVLKGGEKITKIIKVYIYARRKYMCNAWIT